MDLFMLEKKCNYLPVASWFFGSRCFGTLNPPNMIGIYMFLKGFFPKEQKEFNSPLPIQITNLPMDNSKKKKKLPNFELNKK